MREAVVEADSKPHVLAKLNQYNVTLDDPQLKQDMAEAKAEFLAAVGGPGENVMRKLGMEQLSGMIDAYSIHAVLSPFRLFWYSSINVIMVKSAQPCSGSDVTLVVKELAARIEKHLPEVLPRIGFHINSGTHGDELGHHALPNDLSTRDYVEPQFLQEDLSMAVYESPVKITIADLGTMERKCPKCCLVVIDAFCWSGRGHHHHPGSGDPRLGENVELVTFPDKAPYLKSDTWEEENIVEHNGALSNQMTLDEAKELLLKEPRLAAFCRVGGCEMGMCVERGPLAGQLLSEGDVVFFADGFHYWVCPTETAQACTTVTKEPRMMKGA